MTQPEVTRRERRRKLPLTTSTGPLTRILTRRELTPEELAASHLERRWSLFELACGHFILRIDNGQPTARCGTCKAEGW